MSAAAPGGDAQSPEIVRDEERSLVQIRTLILEHPEGTKRSERDIVEELIILRNEMREAKAEDRGSFSEQISRETAILDQRRKADVDTSVDPDSPYFAHLRLTETGTNREQDVFLGRATRLGDGLRIVDWRNAPISRLFYQYEQGDEYEEEMGGRMKEGRVALRRTVHIQGGELRRVGAPEGTWVRQADGWSQLDPTAMRLAGGEGQALRQGNAHSARLGAGVNLRADKHLPDIAALIDPDQFDLITRSRSGVVVLRGSAGSGKTTVALHRIAYLAFQGKRRFPTHRVMVIVWGRAMRDYVAHVLPALGVKGVQVSTWSKWSRDTVRRLFPHLPSTQAGDTPADVTRLKLHPGVTDLLERHIRGSNKKATPGQALQDVFYILTDTPALKLAVGDDMTPEAVERAVHWCTDESSALRDAWNGDREVDARLDVEDDALLLRAFQLRVGPLTAGGNRPIEFAHLVLDEVQDFSPVEVLVLLDCCDKHKSVTLAGDTRQHISENAGFSSWQDFLSRIGVESTALSTLEVSYRSTHAITSFALSVLNDDDEPPPRTTRTGPPVEFFRFSDHGAAVGFLSGELRRLQRAEPHANIALLTPDAGLADVYAEGLARAHLTDVRRVREQRFAFAAGIDVVEAREVKGLEFDYVVIVEASARYWLDDDHHRRLMHVAATRAVHQLWITCVGSPSPILPDTVR